jgi:AraC-like DNA-binding protein
MSQYKQFAFKKFGYQDLQVQGTFEHSNEDIRSFVKICLIHAGGKVIIDFKEYHLEKAAMFFIGPGQFCVFDQACKGCMIYYNRDFYCIEIHDKEVACDGLLFHNAYQIPMIYLEEDSLSQALTVFQEIKNELKFGDQNMEEMLRIWLKLLIIRSTRLWKLDNHGENHEREVDMEFSRRFSQMVEWYFKKYHAVSDYANILNITPKALNKRIKKANNTSPNDVIKNRIILEAKRLLVHTDLSVKEVAFKLGYDDPSYFIRFFSKQTNFPPHSFRIKYQHS